MNVDGTQSGRWTKEEHENFLVGLKLYGREWKKVAKHIKTRTSAQIRSHAQKYFAKLSKHDGDGTGNERKAPSRRSSSSSNSSSTRRPFSPTNGTRRSSTPTGGRAALRPR